MGKLEFGEAKSFGKVHRTSSVWDSNPVFSYLKAQCPPLLTCHFWAHVTELESCGSFWRLDRIYMLCEMTLLSARKVEPESLFLFLEFKTDRHSSWARGDLGQTNTCLPQKEPSPPPQPPEGLFGPQPSDLLPPRPPDPHLQERKSLPDPIPGSELPRQGEVILSDLACFNMLEDILSEWVRKWTSEWLHGNLWAESMSRSHLSSCKMH